MKIFPIKFKQIIEEKRKILLKEKLYVGFNFQYYLVVHYNNVEKI